MVTPSALKVLMTLVSESMTPRTSPSLASILWMVGSETPARSANVFWSIPSSARAARICAAVITLISGSKAYWLHFQALLEASSSCLVFSRSSVGAAPSIPKSAYQYALNSRKKKKYQHYHN